MMQMNLTKWQNENKQKNGEDNQNSNILTLHLGHSNRYVEVRGDLNGRQYKKHDKK